MTNDQPCPQASFPSPTGWRWTCRLGFHRMIGGEINNYNVRRPAGPFDLHDVVGTCDMQEMRCERCGRVKVRRV